MAEKTRQQPATIAGIVRYDQEDKESLIKLKPAHVIELCVALIAVEIILLLAVQV